MPAAILVPALIGAAGAGASIYGAKNGANAARDAAALQVAASDRAQQFNERAYSDQKQAMNPYMQLGSDAMARYQQKYGGQPAGGQRPAPMGAPPPMVAAPQGQPRGMSPFGAPPPQGPSMQPGAPPQGQPGEPMVLMVGPDGEQKSIPQSNVPQALALGAKQVQQ